MNYRRGFLFGFLGAAMVLLCIAAGLKPTQYMVNINNGFTNNTPNDWTASGWGYWGTNAADGFVTNRGLGIVYTNSRSSGSNYFVGTDHFAGAVQMEDGSLVATNPLIIAERIAGETTFGVTGATLTNVLAGAGSWVNGVGITNGVLYGNGSQLTGVSTSNGYQTNAITTNSPAGMTNVIQAIAGAGTLTSQTNDAINLGLGSLVVTGVLGGGSMNITGTLSTATLVVTNGIDASVVPNALTNNDTRGIVFQNGLVTGGQISVTSNIPILELLSANGNFFISSFGRTLGITDPSNLVVLSITNGAAIFPSNVTAWSFRSTSNSAVGVSTLAADSLSASNSVSGNQFTITNGGAQFSAPVTTTTSTTNDPGTLEFPVAGWVRGLFNNGILDYASAATAIGFTNADSANQVVYMFTNAIPPSSTRVWASAFLTNNGYVGSVTTTNRFTFISGPAVVNAYLGLSSGGGDALSVNPELYYSYDGTNWLGDYDCQPQALTTGRTNLYQFVITFPAITATNSTGFFVERRLKVRSVGGTPTMYFMVGTNIVSGTNNASHISFSGPSSVNSGSILKASGYGTNTTLYGSAVGTNAVYIDATGETLSNALGAVFISSGSIKATNTAATTWFKTPTNSPTDGQVLTASGAAADTKWATPAAGGGGGTNSGPIALAYDGTIVTNVAVLLTTPVGCVTNAILPYRLTMTTNALIQNPTGTIQDGQRFTIEFIQDGTGSRLAYFDTQYTFGTDITGITLSTTASKRDFITCIYNSTGPKVYVVGFVRGY